MVKGYLEYIKEHFGAITIEYPPETMFTRNPSEPKPLGINSTVSGTGRIPMHWNDSPYMSGGFSGSGYGRFGEDPVQSNVYATVDSYIEKLKVLDKVYNEYMDLSKSTFMKPILEMKDDIESGVFDPNEDDEALSGEFNSIGMNVYVEIIDMPTSGDSGSYYDPPEPGEPGNYEINISGPLDDKDSGKFLNLMNIKSMNELDDLQSIIDRVSLLEKPIGIIMSEMGMDIEFVSLLKTADIINYSLDKFYLELDDALISDSHYDTELPIMEIVDEDFNIGFIKYLTKIGSIKPDQVRKIMDTRKRFNFSKYGLTKSSEDERVKNVESGIKNILRDGGLDTSRY